MDLNILRSIATLMMFALFVGIVFWAWSRRRQSDFTAAEQLPFVDEPVAHTQSGERA